MDYSGGVGNGPISIFFVQPNGKGKWKKVKLFSKDLTTQFNDGPVTFNANGDISYYSRNMFIIRDQKKNPYYRNKLGLFSANLSGKEWKNINPFRYNNDWFNITTPCLSPDGQRLYFSSDKPDGFGGADLYYCEWKNGYWNEPVNLGPEVNTAGNEAYPFVNTVGELFFSSDGHPGMGGKDIFVTKVKDRGWHKPVRLDAPINSIHDDFGLVADALTDSGYFSSQRDRTIDIYSFNTIKRAIWFSSPQKNNNYCVTLKDNGALGVDSILFEYEWDFGGGLKRYGKQIRHCFPGTGNYTVNVNIVDRRTKEVFFHKSTYQIEMKDFEQPFIHSDNNVVLGDTLRMDGLKSNCPNHDIMDFYWQIGDTSFKTGPEFTYLFKEEGEHSIRLGVALRSKKTGEISKKAVYKTIRVFGSKVMKDKFVAEQNSTIVEDATVADADNYNIKRLYGAEYDKKTESVYRLQLLVADKKVALDSPVFSLVPSKYQIQERFNEQDSTFSYIIDEQRQLISVYPAYEALRASGYEGAQVTFNALTDPAEIELSRIAEKYGVQIDDLFNDRNVLKTNGILMLNNVVGLFHRYPDIHLQIDVHTNNLESAYRNNYLSQSLAQIIADYLVSTGIKANRLIPRGKGEAYPIRSNMLEEGRKINQRVEFRIVHQKNSSK